MSGTRFQKPVTIGAAVTVLGTLGTAVMLYLAGQLQLTREVNFIQTGVVTGAVLQVGGVTQQQLVPDVCNEGAGSTASGGLAKYPFCLATSPLSTTGTLLLVALDCGNVPLPFTLSGGFVKTSTAAVTSAFQNFNDKSVGTGSFVVFSTGSNIWNPADKLKIQALATGWNTGNDCQLVYGLRDKYGS